MTVHRGEQFPTKRSCVTSTVILTSVYTVCVMGPIQEMQYRTQILYFILLIYAICLRAPPANEVKKVVNQG